MPIEYGSGDDTLEFNLLVKVNGEFGLSVWRVLCEDCAERLPHRFISVTEKPCDECGRKVWPD